MPTDLLTLHDPRLWPRKTPMVGDPLSLLITASQDTPYPLIADTVAWPGDRLRLPLDPQPQRQLHG
jgi:hypothetical protein